MNIATLSFATSLMYCLAALLQLLGLYRKLTFKRSFFLIASCIAIAIHGYLLYRWIDLPVGQNLSLSYMFSLLCWLISIMIVLVSLIKPTENLLVFVLPLSAGSIMLALWIPGKLIFQTNLYAYGLIHILISILSCGFLCLAAFQAALLYYQNRMLKTQTSSALMTILPPLQTMEQLLFQMMGLGFLLLTISLCSALLLIQNFQSSDHSQKIILSLLTWGLFAFLLYKRHYSGLRGLKAIQWTLIGVGLLISAFLAGRFTLVKF